MIRMNTRKTRTGLWAAVLSAAAMSSAVLAQSSSYYSYSSPNPSPQLMTQVPQLNDSQVADLTSSVALYPDPLLAVMLPAASYPEEIISADRWLAQNPAPGENALQSLPFDESVKALMHYPSVLHMMADHADWTQALGTAFVYQQGDVLNSIQQWRATAQSAGTLYSTPQEQVVSAGSYIQIVPAQPDVIYVPEYDPAVVYVQSWDRPHRDAIRFSASLGSARWLDHDMDWRDRVVRVPVRPDRDDDRSRGDQRTVRDRDNKQVWTRDSIKPSLMYPERVVTPTPERTVVTPRTPTSVRNDQQRRPDVRTDDTPRSPVRTDTVRPDVTRSDAPRMDAPRAVPATPAQPDINRASRMPESPVPTVTHSEPRTVAPVAPRAGDRQPTVTRSEPARPVTPTLPPRNSDKQPTVTRAIPARPATPATPATPRSDTARATPATPATPATSATPARSDGMTRGNSINRMPEVPVRGQASDRD